MSAEEIQFACGNAGIRLLRNRFFGRRKGDSCGFGRCEIAGRCHGQGGKIGAGGLRITDFREYRAGHGCFNLRVIAVQLQSNAAENQRKDRRDRCKPCRCGTDHAGLLFRAGLCMHHNRLVRGFVGFRLRVPEDDFFRHRIG